MNEEKWLSIKGYRGWYDISNHGRVRSWKDGKTEELDEPKIIGGYLSDKGYRYACFYHNGKTKSSSIHSLVASAFIGDRPSGMHIDHVDGNKENNNVSNLEYVTPRQNSQRYRETLSSISGKVGVSTKNGKFCASITANGKNHHIMLSEDKEECRAIYLLAVEHLADGYDSLLEFIGNVEEHIDEYRYDAI